MVTNRTNSKVKEVQKSINLLKTFRPKCGKLKENGLLDPQTRSAIAEFSAACKQHMVDYFKNDFRATLVILDYFLSDYSTGGNAALVKSLLDYRRRAIQKIIWFAGVKGYLEPNNYTVAAEMLLHSLQNNPSPIIFDNSSEAAEKIKKLDVFRNGIKEELLFKSSHKRSHASFSGEVSLDIGNQDNTDLYYSLGKIDVKYYAYFDQKNGWLFECQADDIYNFDEFREISLKEIFNKGLKQMIKENMGSIANNMGLFSQMDKAITPYPVSISFTYYYKE